MAARKILVLCIPLHLNSLEHVLKVPLERALVSNLSIFRRRFCQISPFAAGFALCILLATLRDAALIIFAIVPATYLCPLTALQTGIPGSFSQCFYRTRIGKVGNDKQDEKH